MQITFMILNNGIKKRSHNPELFVFKGKSQNVPCTNRNAYSPNAEKVRPL